MSEPFDGMTTMPDGATLAWTEWPGSGAPIVLVHGITDRRAMWFDIPQRFAAAGHRVLAVDLRGHGASSRTAPYDPVTMSTDLATVVREVIGGPALLVGHSLGGMVVTGAASLAPDVASAVVNVDQPLKLDDFGALVASIWPMLESDFHATLAAVFATMIPESLDPTMRAAFAAQDQTAEPEVVRAIWAPMVEMAPEDLAALVDDALGGIAVPYLALHGSDPGDGYREWLQRLIPSAGVEVWEGEWHSPHRGDPAPAPRTHDRPPTPHQESKVAAWADPYPESTRGVRQYGRSLGRVRLVRPLLDHHVRQCHEPAIGLLLDRGGVVGRGLTRILVEVPELTGIDRVARLRATADPAGHPTSSGPAVLADQHRYLRHGAGRSQRG